ncbi:hypothetical protein A2U01_0038084, partial [Trifolium medium]|nr:hypothetical protein [Trifolium medium]
MSLEDFGTVERDPWHDGDWCSTSVKVSTKE